MECKQTGKRKNRPNNQDQDSQGSQFTRRGDELEEASAPDDAELRRAKRRPSARDDLDEEQKATLKTTTAVHLSSGKRVPTRSLAEACPSQRLSKTR